MNYANYFGTIWELGVILHGKLLFSPKIIVDKIRQNFKDHYERQLSSISRLKAKTIIINFFQRIMVLKHKYGTKCLIDELTLKHNLLIFVYFSSEYMATSQFMSIREISGSEVHLVRIIQVLVELQELLAVSV